MTLEQLGNVGEFVAAIATLITLVYLAIQIRQNSRTIRVAAYTSDHERANSVMTEMAQVPETFAKGLSDIRALTPEEAFQFTMLVGALFNHFQTSYFQHREGLLPEDVWQRVRAVATWWMSQRGIQSAMKILDAGYDPAFIQAVSPSRASPSGETPAV